MPIKAIHPELGEKNAKSTQIVAEFLYSKYKVTCLNGLKLKESRSIKLQNTKGSKTTYYVTPSAFNKLSEKYVISNQVYFD